MLLIDLPSERATYRLLLAPLVLWLWLILSKRVDTPLGSRFLDSLYENILILWANRSSILRMANLAKSGSVWEIGLLLAAMILTKLFWRDTNPQVVSKLMEFPSIFFVFLNCTFSNYLKTFSVIISRVDLLFLGFSVRWYRHGWRTSESPLRSLHSFLLIIILLLIFLLLFIISLSVQFPPPIPFFLLFVY